MARDEAIDYLNASLAAAMAIAALPGTDTPDGLGIPLDQTDRAMTYVDVPDTDYVLTDAIYNVLAEYFTLLQIRKNIALRFNVGVRGNSFSLQQSLAGVNVLIDAAREAALFLAGPAAVGGGTGADPSGGMGISAIDLDYSGDCRPEEYARW